MARFFGTPPNIHVGQQFIDRRDLHDSFVHAPLQAGISGTRAEGADSIVVSGGYVDDIDYGNEIIYTGHGGNDPKSRRQVADQSQDASGNAGLITSLVQGLPVRVIRGSHRSSKYAPTNGFVFAGLFIVTSHWMERGRDGYLIVRFRLERVPEQAELVTAVPPQDDPGFFTSTVTRRIRDSAMSRELKKAYSNRCQLCSTAIEGFAGRRYSEGAHVRPLGRTHLGKDNSSNLLCLCPNHHTQLDIGGMVILNDLTIADSTTLAPLAELKFRADHLLDTANVAYHRSMWTKPDSAKVR